MIDINVLSNISSSVLSWFNVNREIKKEKKEEFNIAVGALSLAILETKTYLSQGFENRNQGKQSEIREYWRDAYQKLVHVEEELARNCFGKAEYWADPDKWTEDDDAKYDIQLESMSNSLNNLRM